MESQPTIHLVRGQDGLDVEEDALGLTQGARTGGAHSDKVAVGNGEDEGVVGAVARGPRHGRVK